MEREHATEGNAMAAEPDLESNEHTRGNDHIHPLDPISLALGLIFAVIGGAFLFGDVDAANASPAWVVVSLFGALGVILIAIGLRGRG